MVIANGRAFLMVIKNGAMVDVEVVDLNLSLDYQGQHINFLSMERLGPDRKPIPLCLMSLQEGVFRYFDSCLLRSQTSKHTYLPEQPARLEPSS